MNKVRLLGLALLIIGIILILFVKNDLASFLSGAFIGAGIILAIIGRFRSKSKSK